MNRWLFFTAFFCVYFSSCDILEKKQKNNSKEALEFISKPDSTETSSQTVTIRLPPCTDCNKTDEKGKKQGLWVESGSKYYSEVYYKDGLKNGVYRGYRLLKEMPILEELGEYKDGVLVGNMYLFGGRGREHHLNALLCIYRNITENTDIIAMLDEGEEDEGEEKPPYKAYYEGYYPSGILSGEGMVLFYDRPAEVHSVFYGTWKYYNKKGNLTETKIYNKKNELLETKGDKKGEIK